MINTVRVVIRYLVARVPYQMSLGHVIWRGPYTGVAARLKAIRTNNRFKGLAHLVTRPLGRLVVLGVLGIFAASCQPSPPKTLIIRAGRLVDGTSAPPRDNVQITIENGTILSISADVFAPPPEDKNTRVIDAKQLTVMPGLIDAHVHLLGAHSPVTRPGSQMGRALIALRDQLRAGITTVADQGAALGPSLALRDFVGTARGRGPRLLVAGPILAVLSPELGHENALSENAANAQNELRDLLSEGVIVELTSANQARGVVRRLVDQEVDFVTIAFDPVPTHNPTRFQTIVCAAAEEAKHQDIWLIAQATTPLGYEVATTCGVSAFGHGLADTAGPAMVSKLSQQQLAVAATLRTFGVEATSLSQGGRGRFCAHEVGAADPQQLVRTSHIALLEMLRGGVAIGFGTDTDTALDAVSDGLGHELYNLQVAGLEPSDILRAATSGAARVLNLHDAIGTLVPGYRGDLIAVRGNPDKDLRALEHVELVVIDGVVQDLEGPGPWARLWLGLRAMWSKLGE